MRVMLDKHIIIHMFERTNYTLIKTNLEVTHNKGNLFDKNLKLCLHHI